MRETDGGSGGPQLPGSPPQFSVNLSRARGAHRCFQCRVVQQRPGAQRVEHPVRHVGGGRLGEGDAEDARRIDARQQQPYHPLRQHVRLSRSGVGGHPGRAARV